MKNLMLFGGLVGFVISAALGIFQECSSSEILWRSTISASAGGMLFRWWSAVLVRSFRSAKFEKYEALEKGQSVRSVSSAKS